MEGGGGTGAGWWWGGSSMDICGALYGKFRGSLCFKFKNLRISNIMSNIFRMSSLNLENTCI